MHVLHLSADYAFQKIYRELLSHFDPSADHFHTMYVPLGRHQQPQYANDCEPPNCRVIYSRDFNGFDRLCYRRKVKKVCAAVECAVPRRTIDLVHAHTLFSMGGVAYEFKKRWGVDYLVAVRNTDLNTFFRYGIHLRRLGLRILEASAKVIFLSTSYRDALLDSYVPKASHERIRSKSLILPNGISDYWFKNRYGRPPRDTNDVLRLLYVGEITKNKNLATTIAAARMLHERGYRVSLRIVGRGPDTRRIQCLAAKCQTFVAMHDWSDSPETLLGHYRQADVFVMPSFFETFGLVYVEAMSQGLPLIYTRGQGFDGHFPDGTVGYACDPHNPAEIADRMVDIMKNYERFSATCTRAIDGFSWNDISRRYEDMYVRVLESNHLTAGRQINSG